MAALREQAERLLKRQSDRGRLPPILIQGETGTGKGLLARALHRASGRARGPFVDLNCAAIPETLLEAELFGHERGAFTDARQAKPGLFQVASQGTLFLDEIGLLRQDHQAKLLKAIEDRVVRRVGGTRSEAVDVWVLAASNMDLAIAARERRFREDLYQRLAVVTLTLPSLRSRGRDVLLLAEHFLDRACSDYALGPKTLASDAREALVAYAWPGNVRELANTMERVALLSETATVTAAMLGLPEASGEAPTPSERRAAEDRIPLLEGALGKVEREHLLDALRETRWNVTHAADKLGISRDTLRHRMSKHALRPDASSPVARRRLPRSERAGPPAAGPPAAMNAELPSVPTRWEHRRITLLRAAFVVPPGADPRVRGNRALEAFMQKVESFGGRMEEAGPTGVVAAFGVEPIEDAARRAAHAAMAIQKAAERAESEEGAELPIKLAIHVDQFLVSQGGGSAQLDLDGKRQAWTVLEALISSAKPGQIILDEGGAPFLARHFGLVPVDSEASGIGKTYRLVASEISTPDAARVAPFVGRRQEIELLRNRLAAAARGHGQVVGIVGEVGIGKSRLLAEFRESLREEGVTYREGHCQSWGSAVPYLPLLDILRQNFRITELDAPEVIAEKVRSALQHVEMDAAAWAPYFLSLFGIVEGTERLSALTPGAIKANTFEALRHLTLIGSSRRPIVFVVEDLQWIDSVSEECLAALMDSAVGTSGMLVVTYRPGYRPPWMDRSYFSQISLQPLSHEDSLSVMRTLLKEDHIPEKLATVVLEKTEGNPFFLEELCRVVRETGDLRPPVAVPDTIQEVLLTRIERLPEELKQLLQTASILGHEVPVALLRTIWEQSGALEPLLRELARLEFLSKRSGDADPIYLFTHTLTQEVAYESLPPARRQALHAAVGKALETMYVTRLEEVTNRLAHHYSRTTQADKAVLYLARLAEKAARGHAHTEAVRILGEALGHCDGLANSERERRRLELVLHQASSLIYLGAFQAIVELLLQHRETLERLQDAALGGQYHFLMSRSYLFLGDDERASWHATMGITEATKGGDDATRGKIHYVLAQRGALSGRPREGLEHGREAAVLLERAGEGWWVGPAHWAVGLSHALRGEFEPALLAEAKASAIGEAVGDPQLRSSSAWATGVIHTALGDHETGIAACHRALEHSPDPLDTAIGLGWLGYAYVEKGEGAEAITPLEQSIQELGQFRFAQLLGLFTVVLAEARRMTGELDRAAELVRHGLEVASRAHWPFGVGWAQRVLGRIAQDRGEFREAETRLGEALRAFDSMEGRYDVARTHLDLAKLAHARGDPAAVGAHLAEARRRFHELGIPRYVERTDRLAAELRM
jgi:transcriptional regulator with AAA-type ATPase domain/tetratricopeptide (TPR) repeat protein